MPFSKKKEDKRRLIPVVTDRSVIPIKDFGDIDKNIDDSLLESERCFKKIQQRHWFRKIFNKEEGVVGKIYCLFRLIDAFF